MLRSVFDSIGKVALFGAKAVRDACVPPFEGEYLLTQFYEIGVGSVLLVVASGFALGVVMTRERGPAGVANPPFVCVARNLSLVIPR